MPLRHLVCRLRPLRVPAPAPTSSPCAGRRRGRLVGVRSIMAGPSASAVEGQQGADPRGGGHEAFAAKDGPISKRQGRRMERRRVDDLAAWDGGAREARRRNRRGETRDMASAGPGVSETQGGRSTPQGQEARFPEEFASFLARQGVDPRVFEAVLPRYVRLGPGAVVNGGGRGDRMAEAHALAQALGVAADAVAPVAWLPAHYRFYAVEGDAVRIAHTSMYRSGELYGVDAASGAAVAALLGAKWGGRGENVLEICCAPGAKLMLISDVMTARMAESGESGSGEAAPCGSVTGVDVSRNRMGATRTMLHKYGAQRARLYVADGRTFDVGPPGREAGEAEWREAADRGLPNRAWFWSSRDLPNDLPAAAAALYGEVEKGAPPKASGTYDAVLVDAECTHDGSIKHVARLSSGDAPEVAQGLVRRVLDPERMEALPALQRELLLNGLRLVKPGGRVVYCTCSFAKGQNEDVVQWALAQLGPSQVELEAIEEATDLAWPCTVGGFTTDGTRLEHCVRFDPLTSKTSSLFIAKLRRKAA